MGTRRISSVKTVKTMLNVFVKVSWLFAVYLRDTLKASVKAAVRSSKSTRPALHNSAMANSRTHDAVPARKTA